MTYKKLLLPTFISMILVLQSPVAVLADDAPGTTPDPTPIVTPVANPGPAATPEPSPSMTPTTTPSPVVPAPVQGPTRPTGPDASTFVFNPTTGNWESSLYIWNPNTGQTSPKTDPGYYYNPVTGSWDTTNYVYHPETGTYLPVVVKSSIQPTTAAPVMTPQLASLMSTPTGLSTVLNSLVGGINGDPTISNTGPNSINTVTGTSSNTGIFDLFSKANVMNTIGSSATTGNASVSGNTTGGSAITGAANVVTNVVNLLNSAWGWAGGALNFFAKNLMGNQTGDITLNPGAIVGGRGGSLGTEPSSITNTGPNSTNSISGTNSNSIQAVNAPTGSINNNIDVLANSGNANVSGNTTGGNAKSGNATATVDLMNLINASIGSGQSFFGLLNIFGNLNGDILFPKGFLTDALASGAAPSKGGSSAGVSGTGPSSQNGITQTNANSAAITNSPTTNISNNIKAGAQTGNASTTDNTTAGNATTGTATTNSNAYNLANTNLVGDNAVLVLVNVLGHWIGGIMNLPTANTSTSALLTGNATIDSTGPSSLNLIGQSNSNSLAITNTPVSTITNNVRAGAISGNASVTNNTTGGNATSGDASVATNVANIVNSSLNLKKWFGVLVVNVFGNWFGSVNKDTSAGNAPQTSFTATPEASQQPTSTTAPRLLAAATSGSGGGAVVTSTQPTDTTVSSAQPQVLAAAVHTLDQTKAATQARDMSQLFLLSAFMLMMAGALFGLGRKF